MFLVNAHDSVSMTALGQRSPLGCANLQGPEGDGNANRDTFVANVSRASLIAFVGGEPYCDDLGTNRWGYQLIPSAGWQQLLVRGHERPVQSQPQWQALVRLQRRCHFQARERQLRRRVRTGAHLPRPIARMEAAGVPCGLPLPPLAPCPNESACGRPPR